MEQRKDAFAFFLVMTVTLVLVFGSSVMISRAGGFARITALGERLQYRLYGTEKQLYNGSEGAALTPYALGAIPGGYISEEFDVTDEMRGMEKLTFSVMVATYQRENPGRFILQIVQGQELLETSYDMADLQDNALVSIEIAGDRLSEGRAVFRVFCEPESDQTPAIYITDNESFGSDVDYYGQTIPGSVCLGIACVPE